MECLREAEDLVWFSLLGRQHRAVCLGLRRRGFSGDLNVSNDASRDSLSSSIAVCGVKYRFFPSLERKDGIEMNYELRERIVVIELASSGIEQRAGRGVIPWGRMEHIKLFTDFRRAETSFTKWVGDSGCTCRIFGSRLFHVWGWIEDGYLCGVCD